MHAILKPSLISLSLATLLSACGSENGSSNATSHQAAAQPTIEDLPNCQQIAERFDGFLDNWTEATDNGPYENGPITYGVSCSWVSPKAQSDNPFEQIQLGALSVNLTVSSMTQSEADARSIGWVVDDEAVADIGGYLAFPMGTLDFNAPLGIIGPQVVVNNVTVAIATAGVYLAPSEETSGLTNRHAIDNAIAIHKLLP